MEKMEANRKKNRDIFDGDICLECFIFLYLFWDRRAFHSVLMHEEGCKSSGLSVTCGYAGLALQKDVWPQRASKANRKSVLETQPQAAAAWKKGHLCQMLSFGLVRCIPQPLPSSVSPAADHTVTHLWLLAGSHQGETLAGDGRESVCFLWLPPGWVASS